MAEGLQSWDFLETLPGIDFFRLYKSPSSALAIFRKRLSSLAKAFVMGMLYMPAPMPLKHFEIMVKDGSIRERDTAINLLQRYHIFREIRSAAGRSFSLTPEFAKSLRVALTGRGEGHSFGKIISVPVGEQVDIDFLDEYARRQWEGILGYMVSSSDNPIESAVPLSRPSSKIIELLRVGGLVGGRGNQDITKEGFSFVLQDLNTQIWSLLFLYAEVADQFGLNTIDVLSFLLHLSSLELGQAYSTESLDSTQMQCLDDLQSSGIVFMPLNDDGTPAPYFYPTRLATTLTSDSQSTISATNATLGSSLSASTPGQGFVIIETNYRVYAYTDSPLQIALLGQFVRLRSRHANLVTGKMTKGSIQRAIFRGITADQIISYLTSHAHPQMRKRAQQEQAQLRARNIDQGKTVPIIPATILDQIHLWEIERERMTATNGFLMKDFDKEDEYRAVSTYADEIGVLIWKNDRKRLFFISRIEQIKTFLQERRGGGQSSSR
jgi:transcription initiation factor TFIIH subunit 4